MLNSIYPGYDPILLSGGPQSGLGTGVSSLLMIFLNYKISEVMPLRQYYLMTSVIADLDLRQPTLYTKDPVRIKERAEIR